jgi:hypothetical protein
MTTLIHARTNWIMYIALLALLAALLWLSPAEATLGNVVKIVYAHGAAQRVAMYLYIVAGALGIAALVLSLRGAQFATKQHLHRTQVPVSPTPSEIASQKTLTMTLSTWSCAVMETALVFWAIQFVVSLPAQVLAWGGISWTEPRVLSALWVLVFTVLVYMVAVWVGDARWMPIAAIANAAIALILLRGAVNILHPIDPILGSESLAIKIFYAAIVLTTGALAILFARDRARWANL